MMTGTWFILCILIPLAGSLLIPLFRNRGWQRIISTLVMACSIILLILLSIRVLSGEIVLPGDSFLGMEVLNTLFLVDGVGCVFAAVFAFLGFIAVLYSLQYIHGYPRQSEYFSMLTLLVGSMIGFAFSTNLVVIYVFWELVTITTWRLVGFYGGKREGAIADKTLLILFAGSSFMLLGFIMLYLQTGSMNLIRLQGEEINVVSSAFIFVGLITKAAVLPLHLWLPDAHTVAPSPMSALLSGVVVKIGLLAYVRILVMTFGIQSEWILLLAGVSSIGGAVGALLETDIKKIIAYSTVSQTGYILLALATNNKTGMVAGLLYFIAHAVAKAGLFMCAGNIEYKTGMRDIHGLKGVLKRLPITGVAFVVCALSIVGIPPLPGFYAKLWTITALTEQGYLWIAALAVVSALMTLGYTLRLLDSLISGDYKIKFVKTGGKLMVSVTLILGIFLVMMGLFIRPFSEWMQVVIGQISH